MSAHPAYPSARRSGARSAVAAAGLLLLAGGCGPKAPPPSVVAGPGRVAPDPLPVAAYPKVVPIDQVEAFLVAPAPPIFERLDNGSSRVRVPLRWTSVAPATLRYRFLFADDSGFQFHQRREWRLVGVEPGVRFELVGRSFESTAADWELQVGAY